MMGNFWGGFGGWGMGWLSMIAFWGLVIFGVALLIKWLVAPEGPVDPKRQSALEILEQRYARGEIGREEYEQKRRDLS